MAVRLRLYGCLLGATCAGTMVCGCAAGNKVAITNPFSSPAATAEKKAPKPDPNLKNPSRVHLAYAKWQEQLEQNSEARESYEIVLGEDPKSVEAILGVARLDQLAGRSAEAQKGFDRAIELAPRDAHVLDSVGQFYVSQKRWAEAIDLLTRASKANPDEKTYRYHLAVAMARSGDIDGSVPHFIHAVGPAEAQYNIGYILYENGQLEASERRFAQAIALKPELTAAQDMLDTVRRQRLPQGSLLASGTRTQSRTASAGTTSAPRSSSAYTPVGHSPAGRSTGSIRSAAGVVPPASVSASYSEPPRPGMTPQQLEQWRNQQEAAARP